MSEGEFLNTPAVCTWETNLLTPDGDITGTIYLDDDQAADYNRDPDLWAAKYFGFTTAEAYRELVIRAGALDFS